MRIRPNSNHHPRQILLVIGFLLSNLQYILTTIFFSGEILLVKELKIVDALKIIEFWGVFTRFQWAFENARSCFNSFTFMSCLNNQIIWTNFLIDG